MKTLKILLCFMALSLCACNCTEKNVGTGDKDNNVSPETAKDVTAYVTTAISLDDKQKKESITHRGNRYY